MIFSVVTLYQKAYNESLPDSMENRLTPSTNRPFLQLDSADDWITQAEAARLRKVTRQSITKLVQKGRFNKTLTVGGQVFLSRSEVLSYTPQTAGRPARVEKSDDAEGSNTTTTRRVQRRRKTRDITAHPPDGTDTRD